jgi:capsule polysaccharide export protein KpsE/RkpR
MAQVMGVMTDNVLQTLQQLIQDVIAPDVRELKVRVSSLEKQMDVRFDAVDVRFQALEQRFDSYDEKTDARFEAVETRFAGVDSRFNALEQKMDAHFVALMAAIGDSKAQAEVVTMRLISPLAERIAVLEAQRR